MHRTQNFAHYYKTFIFLYSPSYLNLYLKWALHYQAAWSKQLVKLIDAHFMQLSKQSSILSTFSLTFICSRVFFSSKLLPCSEDTMLSNLDLLFLLSTLIALKQKVKNPRKCRWSKKWYKLRNGFTHKNLLTVLSETSQKILKIALDWIKRALITYWI